MIIFFNYFSDTTISQQESLSVVLPCPVNVDKCGKLHSLNWFKGDDRIAAMLLGESNVTSVNKEFDERVTVEQNPYRLVIKDLKIADEDIYLCDTTFFIPEETCDNFNGYRIELRVLVPPTEVVILDAKGDRIENGSIVGPMQERQSLKATCTVKNTRPQPEVGWFRGDKRLTTYSPTHDLNDGLYTSTLELDWPLSREDLAQDIECRVNSAAIPNTTVTKFSVDLQVRPTSIDVNGVKHHTVQGSKVVLTCDIQGARPAVNLTWYNSSALINPDENDITEIRIKSFEKKDGTYHTQSELIFNATRFENDRVFRCEAENVVLQINREKPISSGLTLEVLYPPVVKVSPSDIMTNTSEIVLLNCEYVANPASLTQVEWYRNDDLVNVNDTNHYKGGNSENVALVIKSTEKDDIGNYSCKLSNTIGKGISDQKINLDVQYVPSVEILMIPEGPVKESDESNVTLFCNVLDANPLSLTKVRWYANSTLLKELPDCEETREDLCHIDPSKLLLESIGRGFFYNYSCEGYNSAGWGQRSEDKELLVHYEPGPSALTHFPLVAVKKKSVTFSCSVDDPGYPDSNRYRWLRGGRGPLQDIVTKDWTVEPVGLDSRTNYSCYAYNEGGKGVMATVNLEVHAPPFFIKNLPPYTGVLHSSQNATLTCRIECVPRCEISWQKDDKPIERNDTRYFIKEKYMEASPPTGDFESMLSVLHFNMSNWPLGKFDIEADNANYTCVSTGNTVGASIRSRTYFAIEYAPDNTTVSENIVYVQEDTIPGRIICKSRANPEPSYKWFFKNETLANGNALIINTAMKRNNNGTYTCQAENKHGKSIAETVIEVQFKPRCEIERREIDDQDTLICTAFGNPLEADFSWSIKAENDTVQVLGSGDKKTFSEKSFYILETDYAISRTYRCVANNTVGSGPFCEIEVAEQLAWWQLWEKNTLIIIVAVILGLLLTVIIICCIIICICRRRRRQDKCDVLSDQSEITQAGGSLPIQDKTTAFLANSCLTSFNANAPKSPPRWPIRPGVMLHVSSNTKENLAVNRMTLSPNQCSKGGNIDLLSAELSDVLRNRQSNSDSTILTDVSVVLENNAASELSTVAVPQLEVAQENKPAEEITHLDNLPAKTPGSGHIKLEHILSLVYKKSSVDCTRESQRSHVGLLQTFWRGLASNKNTTQFGTQHRLKGIRCSGSVTYKKAKETTQGTTNQIGEPSLTNQHRSCQSHLLTFQVPLLDAESSEIVTTDAKKNCSQKIEGLTWNDSPSLAPRQKPCFMPPPQPISSTIPLRNFQNTISWSCSAESTAQSKKLKHVEIHDKSSSLGEPLTEPGEYENLPFHGLQTAPNKFSTTPTNFNNNTNAMRAAQRLKGLNANINLPSVNHQQDRQITQDLHLYQEKHFCDHAHRSQNNTIPRPSSTDQNNQNLTELDSNRQVQLNLTTCFPKSYSEYYQPNQKKHQIQIKLQAATIQKFNTNSLSNDQLTNAIDHDCLPSYPAMCRPPSTSRSALLSTNPFLAATNFKKYDEEGEDLSASMSREKHCSSALDVESKFYSLKFPGGSKLKNRSYNENSSLGSITSHTTSTCKTHNLFAYNSQGDIVPSVQPICLYDPPAYENTVAKDTADLSTESIKIDSNDIMTNSNQNLATVQLHRHLGKDVIKKHHHRHPHHQQKKDEGIAADLQLMEPERVSIYRSDSGISNSSYESQFPIPFSQKRTKIPKKGTVNSTSGSLIRKHGIKNVEAQNSGSIHVDSSNILSSESKVIESGVSLDNNSTSISACASSSHCMRNQPSSIQYNDKTTGEDFEQHRLGHQCVYSVSTPSVCNSLNTSSKSNYRLTAPLKCSNVQTPNKKKKLLAINPFLAKYQNNNTYTGDKSNRKLRRQTISNPYEHIQRHQSDVSREIQGYRSDAFKAHSFGPKCDSGDSQTTSTEQMEIINNAAETTHNRANRKHSEGVLVSKKLMIQTSRLGPVAGIDFYPPEIPSNFTNSPADEEYDCVVVRRPIRLPLRKHHTFHFHRTQTANSMLHELRERLQLQLQERELEKQNVPLVFSPLELSEQHAFKPISPTPTMTALAEQKTRYQNQNDFLLSQNDCEHHLKGTEDDEDLGYSFCEEECMVDNDNYPTSDNLSTAPANSSITSKAIENATAGALEYFIFDDEFIYADLESQHYGPINYKAASLYSQVKKNKNTGALDAL
ncbi:hypothetical protein KR084_001851 [Drosophila pseudotakahashii]|nr:hypothetical protein KR084_001851 [Drosophila pseudotakahashii]